MRVYNAETSVSRELNTPDSLQYNFFPNDTGYLRFKVRTSNDAHIALTQSAAEVDPMYEIFIGGWGNQRSVIRKNRNKPDVADVPTPNILNPGEFRSFWVRWDNNTISCGCDNNSQPFMSWRDNDHVQVRYVGVCTGWGANGSWIIHRGAPLPGFGGGNPNQFPSSPSYPGQQPPTNPGYPGQQPPTNTGFPGQQHPSNPGFPGNPQAGFGGTPGFNPPPPLNSFGQQGQFGQAGQFGQQGQFGQPGYNQSNQFNQPGQFPGAGGFGGPGGGFGGVNWVKSSGGNVPPRAFVGGDDRGEPLYVVRCHFQGALLPGKMVASHRTAYVPWGGVENAVSDYEVLCDFNGRWAPCSGGNIPPNAVSGGQSETGEPLFVGRARHEGTYTVGKVQRSHNCCYIPYGGQEISYQQFEILLP